MAKVARVSFHRQREDGSFLMPYLFLTTSSLASHMSQYHVQWYSQRTTMALLAMSFSVLAKSSTLPPFWMENRLLSTKVVMRIIESNNLEQGGALHRFIKT